MRLNCNMDYNLCCQYFVKRALVALFAPLCCQHFVNLCTHDPLASHNTCSHQRHRTQHNACSHSAYVYIGRARAMAAIRSTIHAHCAIQYYSLCNTILGSTCSLSCSLSMLTVHSHIAFAIAFAMALPQKPCASPHRRSAPRLSVWRALGGRMPTC